MKLIWRNFHGTNEPSFQCHEIYVQWRACGVSLATGTDVALSPKYENSFQVGDTIWGEEVCILKISDTGVGISAETINKIYEPFFSDKRQLFSTFRFGHRTCYCQEHGASAWWKHHSEQ